MTYEGDGQLKNAYSTRKILLFVMYNQLKVRSGSSANMLVHQIDARPIEETLLGVVAGKCDEVLVIQLASTALSAEAHHS